MEPLNKSPIERHRASPEEWMEWSRHYDNLTWGVIVIFTAAVGALLAYSFTEPTVRSALPEIAGLVITVLGVFYVASFRRFRHRIHENLPEGNLKDFLKNPGATRVLHQWNAFVLPFVAIDVFFVYRLAERLPFRPFRPWPLVCGVAVIAVVFFALWKWAGQQTAGMILKLVINLLFLLFNIVLLPITLILKISVMPNIKLFPLVWGAKKKDDDDK